MWLLAGPDGDEVGGVSDRLIETGDRETVAREIARRYRTLPPPLADDPVCVWDITDESNVARRNWPAATAWAGEHLLDAHQVYRIVWLPGGAAMIYRYTGLTDPSTGGPAWTVDRLDLDLPPAELRA